MNNNAIMLDYSRIFDYKAIKAREKAEREKGVNAA